MLKDINDIYGNPLVATDGKIGHVKDFYFDDESWIVRYLVVDTGSWLPGRQVLLSPQAFDGLGKNGDPLHVNLTKEKIANSPSIESRHPVTRQQERDYYRYYGWPAYWDGGGMWEIGGLPVPSHPAARDNLSKKVHDSLEGNHQLLSTRSVTEYDIKASDGLLGSISGFLVDHLSWAIADLVVESGPWYSGKQILISPSAVKRICYTKSEVMVKVNRSNVQRNLEDEVAKPAFSLS